jgi:chorismate--pyruvate lyase
MPINTHLIFSLKALCSNHLLEWLHYQSPLTDKLCQEKGEAQLELIAQHWKKPDFWSKNLLNIQDVSIFQREILMKSNQIIYWYARSFIPKKCYDLEPDFFNRLKKESIKNLIFEEDQVQRINSINYPINKECVEFYWVTKYINRRSDILWVRLNEYSYQKKQSFYLIEILFPQLEEGVS